MSTSVAGLSDLQNKLKELDAKVAKNDMRRAVAAGGRVIRDRMKAMAPRKSGDLASSMRVSTRADASKGQFIAKVGPKLRDKPNPARKAAGKKGLATFTAYEALWAEFGVKMHVIKPSTSKALAFDPTRAGSAAKGVYSQVVHPGRPAKDFMVAATDQSKDGAVRAVKESLEQSIAEVAKR